MITFSHYRKILQELSATGLQSRRIADLKTHTPQRGDLFIKHDVEARVDLALSLAEIEAEEGHKCTYYFQGDLLKDSATKACVQKIQGLGHEATLHYDVLDANDGDYQKAISQFDGFLATLAEWNSPVLTVCPHGNPTKVRDGWKSNKDFFRSSEVRQRYPDLLDIVVDFPSLFPNGTYVSDAGFKLRVIGQIATNDKSNEAAIIDGKPIDWPQLTSLAQQSDGLVVSIHPHRLRPSALALYSKKYGFFLLKQGYMATKRIPLVKSIANKFHQQTRKF